MKRSSQLSILSLVVLLLLLAPSVVFTIHETESGVVTRFGRPREAIAPPGLHFKMPWPIDEVLRLDRRLLVFDGEPAEMLTKDKRNVVVDSFILWRIEDPIRFAQTARTRPEAEARLLDLAASALGAAVGRVPMESLISLEPDVPGLKHASAEAADSVREMALAGLGIEIVDLRINGFNLPRQNRASVIERMRAERATIATAYRSEGEEEALKIEADATKERNRLLAEAESTAKILRGVGESEALTLLAEAYARDPRLYRLLRDLESYETILDSDTTIFLESDSELLETLHGK